MDVLQIKKGDSLTIKKKDGDTLKLYTNSIVSLGGIDQTNLSLPFFLSNGTQQNLALTNQPLLKNDGTQ